MLYEIVAMFYRFLVKVYLMGFSAFNLQLFRFKDVILMFNIKLFFPIAVGFMLALYIYYKAHKVLEEKWKYPNALFVYLFVFPFLRSLHWVTAFFKEFSGLKTKW